MIPTYKTSGKFGVLTLPMLLLGVVLIALLAYVYQIAIHWIPFIYINVLLTVGVGIAIGVVSSIVITRGRVRNVMVGCLVALLLSVAFISAKFVFQYYHEISLTKAAIRETTELSPEQKQEALAYMDSDYTFMDHLEERIADGWQIGRAGGGAPITGMLVYLIWAIEAGIVIYVSVKTARDAAGVPYNETVDQWADESEVVMTLPITSSEMVSQIESAQTVDDLLSIPIPKTDESDTFAVYTVNSVMGQEMEDAYLSVTEIVISVNSKGERETAETPIVKNAILSKQQRELLVENASLMQEAFDAYREAKDEEFMNEDEPSDESDDVSE